VEEKSSAEVERTLKVQEVIPVGNGSVKAGKRLLFS
jgi:hypothetical protein